MSKIQLAAHIRSELPRINAALDAITAPLPPSSQKIARHILHAGGKRLRPLLTVLIARLLGCAADDVYPLAATMEMVHAATLLHDDVIDNAASRRGKTAAHHLFGLTQVILGGDALLARASRVVASYDDPRLTACLAAALEETANGQILELDRQNGANLDLDSYFAVIRGKTAWMLRACCEFGALRAGADDQTLEAAAEYGLQIGMAFQIVDDALDFAPASQTGKPEGGDVREGKLTPPMHLYAESLPPAERAPFVDRLIRRDMDDAETARITAAVRAQGCDRAARDMADPYLDAARAALTRLVENGAGNRPASRERDLLEAVIRYLRYREL